MSDRNFTAGDGTGGSFQAQMYRRTPKGEIELVDVDFEDYRHPPKGARGRFRLNGWSPYYTTESVYDGKTKTVTRMRAEYEIVKLPGNPDMEGGLFSQQFPVPARIDDPRSKLGQFLRALLNRDFAPGEDIRPDDFIGTEFVTSVTRDEVGEKIYCGISWDTIDPTKTKLAPSVNSATPQHELVGVAAGAGGDYEDDPFDSDEL